MNIVKNVMENDFNTLQKDIEKRIAEKVWSRVQEAKKSILAKMNGIDVEKQKEIMVGK